MSAQKVELHFSITPYTFLDESIPPDRYVHLKMRLISEMLYHGTLLCTKECLITDQILEMSG